MWSEAANLRHLPECLWFLYWILRNSHIKMAEVTLPRARTSSVPQQPAIRTLYALYHE